MRQAIQQFEKTLDIDAENVTALFNRARQRYPAANHAAGPLVIYSLHRHEGTRTE